MKFTVALLCAVLLQHIVPCCSFAQTPYASSGQQDADYVASDAVRVDRVQWWYEANNNSNAATAEITVSNQTDKQIKRIDFNVVATDSSGLVLESEGFAIKKLVVTDTMAPHSRKTFNFDQAFVNRNVADLDVNNAIVEYDNGSIEILTKKR